MTPVKGDTYYKIYSIVQNIKSKTKNNYYTIQANNCKLHLIITSFKLQAYVALNKLQEPNNHNSKKVKLKEKPGNQPGPTWFKKEPN